MLGYVTALALPPVGFVVGIVVALRRAEPRHKHGPWIAAFSIAGAVVWLVLLASGTLTSTNSGY